MNMLEQEVKLLKKQVRVLTDSYNLLSDKFDSMDRAGNKDETDCAPQDSASYPVQDEDGPNTDEPIAQELDVLRAEEEKRVEVETLRAEQEKMNEQLFLEEIGRNTCKVDGCDTSIQAKGYCTSHYNRAHRYGDPLYDPAKDPSRKARSPKGTKRRKNSFCTFKECRGKVHAKGLCRPHYYRARQYGDPGLDSAPAPEVEFHYAPDLAAHYHTEALAIVSGIKEEVLV